MWIDVVLDDLFRGDHISVLGKSGGEINGVYLGLRRACDEWFVQIRRRPQGFPAGSIGASMSYVDFVGTADIASIKRLVCEGV